MNSAGRVLGGWLSAFYRGRGPSELRFLVSISGLFISTKPLNCPLGHWGGRQLGKEKAFSEFDPA